MYLLVNCIKEVCKTYCDKTAIKYYCDERVKSISYYQFENESEGVGEILNSYKRQTSIGFVPQHYVALLLDISGSFPILIQGILLSGNPFVCLDVDGSKRDIVNLIEVLKIEIVITNEQHADKIRANFIRSKKLKEFKILEDFCEVWQTGITEDGLHRFQNVNSNHTPLYAIQTSGSTGEKKIVQVMEECIFPNVLELRDVFKLTNTDVIYFGSPITFDPSVIELFLALTTGATLFIVSSRARAAAIPVLVETLFPEESKNNSSCITFIQTTPSIFRSWPRDLTRERIMNRLKILALGGEICPSWDELTNYCSPTDALKIFNLYGITEVSCWASYCRISPDSDVQYLGVPMNETILQVRNSDGSVVENGVGEMFIGSNSRICILGDESISKLVSDSKNKPLFRATGDLVQVDDNGKTFKYLGRKDRVVKRWGQKVNLALIEDVSRRNELVSNSGCVIDDKVGLVLFYQSHTYKNDNDSVLRSWLRKQDLLLNSASIPDLIVQLHSLPLNSNGKVDATQLMNIMKEQAASLPFKIEDFDNRKISFRSYLKNVWHFCTTGNFIKLENRNEDVNLLNNDCCSSGFIASGGTSISALQFISKLYDLPVKVPSELLSNLLSDCTFNEFYSFFDINLFGESSKTIHHMKQESSQNSYEPAVKRQKVDGKMIEGDDVDKADFKSSFFFQMKSESPISSVKCRGKVIMYSRGYCNHTSANNKMQNVDLCIKWKYFMEKCVDASPTVITFRDGTKFVSVGSHSGCLAYLNYENGIPKSSSRLPDRIESSLAISPCGKYGYIGCYDGNLRSIDIKTGATVLSFATSGMIKSSPILNDGEFIIFGSYDKHLYCISYQFQIIWTWEGSGSFYANPCLDFNKNFVFTGLLDGSCVCLEIKTGFLVWETKLSSPIFSSPLVLESETILFAEVSGTINCLSTHSGSLVWSYKVDGNIFSSLTSIRSDNRTLVLFGCHDKNIYCLCPSPDNKSAFLLWKTCLSAPVFATPFVDSERLVVVAVNTAGNLSLLCLSNGLIMSSFQLPGEVFSSPVIHDNEIFVGCRDNHLYCLQVKI